MRIAVFGLGYVGCVTAACLASEGHRVTGVDVSSAKVRAVNRGEATVEEPGLASRVRASVRRGLLSATEDGPAAARAAGLSLICVGTPGGPDGRPDLRALEATGEAIGRGIRDRKGRPVVVVRSTVPPGTTEGRLVPLLARASGRVPGKGFAVAVNPEFMREGSSIRDYYRPSRVLIGASDRAAAARVRELYRKVKAEAVVTDLRTAEMVKYADNAFHGIKVAFANEIGALAQSFGVDGSRLMEIFVRDTKLNLSPCYLRPGMPYGGSCIPKDTRALVSAAREKGIPAPVLEGSLASNAKHKERLASFLADQGKEPVGLVGLAFKSGTDDFRESAPLDIAAALLRRGVRVKLCDPRLADGRLTGANRKYVEQRLPDYRRHLASLEQVAAWCPLVVVMTWPEALERLAGKSSRGRALLNWTGSPR
ncbi:MAG: nucleotide sugar dehydrogenase [Halobacteria archaeon]